MFGEVALPTIYRYNIHTDKQTSTTHQDITIKSPFYPRRNYNHICQCPFHHRNNQCPTKHQRQSYHQITIASIHKQQQHKKDIQQEHSHPRQLNNTKYTNNTNAFDKYVSRERDLLNTTNQQFQSILRQRSQGYTQQEQLIRKLKQFLNWNLKNNTHTQSQITFNRTLYATLPVILHRYPLHSIINSPSTQILSKISHIMLLDIPNTNATLNYFKKTLSRFNTFEQITKGVESFDASPKHQLQHQRYSHNQQKKQIDNTPFKPSRNTSSIINTSTINTSIQQLYNADNNQLAIVINNHEQPVIIGKSKENIKNKISKNYRISENDKGILNTHLQIENKLIIKIKQQQQQQTQVTNKHKNKNKHRKGKINQQLVNKQFQKTINLYQQFSTLINYQQYCSYDNFQSIVNNTFNNQLSLSTKISQYFHLLNLDQHLNDQQYINNALNQFSPLINNQHRQQILKYAKKVRFDNMVELLNKQIEKGIQKIDKFEYQAFIEDDPDKEVSFKDMLRQTQIKKVIKSVELSYSPLGNIPNIINEHNKENNQNDKENVEKSLQQKQLQNAVIYSLRPDYTYIYSTPKFNVITQYQKELCERGQKYHIDLSNQKRILRIAKQNNPHYLKKLIDDFKVRKF